MRHFDGSGSAGSLVPYTSSHSSGELCELQLVDICGFV